MPSWLGHGLYKKIAALKNIFFVVYSITKLNITRDFGPYGIKFHIRLYRSCYSGPLKCGTWAWALKQEWHEHLSGTPQY